MAQVSQKPVVKKQKPSPKKQAESQSFDFTEMTEDNDSDTGKKQEKISPAHDLEVIDPLIPFNRRFLNISSDSTNEDSNSGMFGKFGLAAKSLMGGFRGKEVGRDEIVKLRQMVGDLKDTKVTNYIPPKAETLSSEPVQVAQKSKRQRLKESHAKISSKSQEPPKDKQLIGLRIEIERLKKQFPADSNLVLLGAILTCRDGCLIHRTPKERVASLSSALREAGQVVANRYLTTYSIDTLFDIYFLYLESLKKLFAENLRKISNPELKANPIAIGSHRRDIQVVNILLEQKKLQKTISNLTQKLKGSEYPFIPISPMLVAKTFSPAASSESEKIGPGTVKLNKSLIRIYLNVLAQIPIFQPIAQNLSKSLPDDFNGKVTIANVNMDNAYTQLKISRVGKDKTTTRQISSLFNYGKQVINANMMNNINTPAEARIFLRTGEMAAEYAFLSDKIDAEALKFGYHCASMSLSHFAKEAEGVIRRLFEIAEIKKIDLRNPTSETAENNN